MSCIRFQFAVIIFTFSILCMDNHNSFGQTASGNVKVSAPADSLDRNNNFYDNTETWSLPGDDINVTGEVSNPGKIDFSTLPKHTVIVKEALLNPDGSNRFVGAYRYDGYSLFDILKDRIPDKKNKAEFSSVIDLYVEIENAKGEKVFLSWGEIFYPNHLHEVIIATQVARIVPSKTKDLWPLPAERKLVVSNDLLAERNIINPVRITIHSFPRSIPVNRNLSPLFSDTLRINENGRTLETVTGEPEGMQKETLHTIFYGKGRGIHSTQPFTGYLLKSVLSQKISVTSEKLKTTMVAVIGKDGYRSVYSLSEIMNRSDQEEILLVPCTKGEDGGLFRIFPACDFFSDRAVKALSEISLFGGK